MTDMIVTFKIMPETPDVNLEGIQEKATASINEFGGEVGKVDIEPIAFGLKALMLVFVVNEDKGSTEELEAKITDFEGVQSVQVTDMRRALG